MEQLQLVVDDRPVAEVLIADNILTGTRGMLFWRVPPEAMLFRPGGSVHGMLMPVALDVAMISWNARVLSVDLLRPWGQVRAPRGVGQTLEAPAGSFERWGLVEGCRVEVR